MGKLFSRTVEIRLPEEGSQRIALRAIIMGALLIGIVTLLAHGCSDNWTSRSDMERVIRLGPRQGAAELERTLAAAHPPGSDIGPFFARLERMGFDCAGALDPARPGSCRFRAQREERRIATVLVEVQHDGLRLAALSARMTVGPAH